MSNAFAPQPFDEFDDEFDLDMGYVTPEAAAAGPTVVEPADSHLCCGSAGTYNLLQPEISGQLKARKVAALEAVRPDVISAGNIGCMIQIGSGIGVPVVHTVELLDWATGGPKPRALDGV